MKSIVKKVLNLDLIGKDFIEHLEKWGALPPGSSDKFSFIADKIPKAKFGQWLEELAEELDKEHEVRETNLDLSRLRWPIEVDIFKHAKKIGTVPNLIAGKITAVRDIAGKFYFRIQDVKEDWFIPGYVISYEHASDGIHIGSEYETIVEKQILYLGDVPVCVQVTTIKGV